MSKAEAEALAERVRGTKPVSVEVVSEGAAFAVQVTGVAGVWMLYDQDDWEAWRGRIDTRVGIRSVLLYKGTHEWRFTVGEDPDAMACGALELPVGTALYIAEPAFRAHVQRYWGHRIEPRWIYDEQTGTWGADLNIPPDSRGG